MKYKNSLLVYPKTIPDSHVMLFTANKRVCKDGLIMGGGNALAFRKAYPEMPKLLGNLVTIAKRENFLNDLKVVIRKQSNLGYYGCVFTKDSPRDPSPVDMVVSGINQLKQHAEALPDYTFHLPYPGIGLGGLTRTQLDPYIETLPDNVIVYVV